MRKRTATTATTTTRNNAARRVRRDNREWYDYIVSTKDVVGDWFWNQNPTTTGVVEDHTLDSLIKGTTTMRERIALLAVLTSGTLYDGFQGCSFMQPATRCCFDNLAYVKRQLRARRSIPITVIHEKYGDEEYYQSYRIW